MTLMLLKEKLFINGIEYSLFKELYVLQEGLMMNTL